MKLTSLFIESHADIQSFRELVDPRIYIYTPGGSVLSYGMHEWDRMIKTRIQTDADPEDMKRRVMEDLFLVIEVAVDGPIATHLNKLGCSIFAPKPEVRPEDGGFHDEDEFGHERRYYDIMVRKEGVFNPDHDLIEWWPPDYINYLRHVWQFIVTQTTT